MRFFGAVMLGVLLFGANTASGQPTMAPAASIDIAKVSCGDLKAATPLDRSAMVMFYWGYAAAKAGATTFKTGLVESATDALMTQCAGNSSELILDAMQRINVKAF
jgi:hypothetical protein